MPRPIFIDICHEPKEFFFTGRLQCDGMSIRDPGSGSWLHVINNIYMLMYYIMLYIYINIIVYHCYYINIHIDIVFSDHGRSIIYIYIIHILISYIYYIHVYLCISMICKLVEPLCLQYTWYTVYQSIDLYNNTHIIMYAGWLMVWLVPITALLVKHVLAIEWNNPISIFQVGWFTMWTTCCVSPLLVFVKVAWFSQIRGQHGNGKSTIYNVVKAMPSTIPQKNHHFL